MYFKNRAHRSKMVAEDHDAVILYFVFRNSRRNEEQEGFAPLMETRKLQAVRHNMRYMFLRYSADIDF
jgi:hypothetical protein